MKLFKDISVRLKIVVIITTVSALSALLSLIVNVSTKIVESKNEFRSDAISDAKLLGDYCIMPIEFNYPERAKEVLNNGISRGDVYCASVYTKDGSLFSSACQDDVDMPLKIAHELSLVTFRGNDLFVIEPIVHDGEYFGAVYLKYHTGLKSDIIKQILIAVVVLVVIWLLSFVLALYFQKYISTPILMLAEKVSEISETQDYKTEIKKLNNDEIGILYDRFNHLLNTINLRELERDQAVEALFRSEEKFRNIFNFSLDGIVVTDMDSNILEASSMMTSIFNIPQDKLKNMSMIDILPPGYIRQRRMVMKELEEKGEFNFVTNYPTENKKELHLEFSSKIINHDGTRAILSLISDITKRIKSDEALRESEERYKKLVENFPSAIVLHRDEEIVFVNDFIKTTLEGKTKREFIGLKILDFFPKNDKVIISNHFKNIENQKNAIPTLEVKMKKLNGMEINVEIASISLFFNKKKTILSVFKDISSRKKIEEELVVALKRAEQSDTLKTAFLANMSHEIRTPMNGIIGFADLLSRDNIQKSDINRYVDIIKQSADKLLTIINDIIDISKIEAGVINISKETFDFSSLVNEIFQFFLPQAEKKGLHFLLEDNIGSVLKLNTDKNKVSQVITNLISNALKFSQEGSVKVSFSIDSNKNTLELVVKDTGIGIPKNQLQSIFERFRQADHYLQDFNEGTGLGLSICRGFIHALDGEIWAESESGKGASFYFELPLEGANPDQLILPGATEDSNFRSLKNKHILIVEDEEYNYLYLKEILESREANILWADDGLKAIQFVLNNPEIDFVLMDIKLPIMDGFTAAQKIKSYRQTLPIVAQTAFGLEGDREKSMAAGLDDYLAKPIRKDELFRVIDKFVHD